ncbi:styrene monooxygenase/indole monooxygenase family protein [Saccharothrix yanglingensis]|uniref:styrene monooxygenase/indole monooxygenase family protein n=1 Tax=Saccharothrix yanglingensis TaxID=659496 RepID=UPI0027D3199E|nr:styrene monooxygenase/indole monooxygenase family protein [Saccharothrix yanglingensis]
MTIHSDRTADELLADRGRPTACLFGDQVEYEAELGLDFHPEAYRMRRIHLDLFTATGGVAFSVDAPLRKPALAVDQRLKFAEGLAELARRGAEVVVGEVTVADLDRLAASHDLVVVAAGCRSLTGLFERDPTRCAHSRAQRRLFMVNVHGYDMEARPEHRGGVFSFLPGTVEVFWVPFHDKDVGESRSVVLEAAPGGPADRFRGVTSADEGVDVLKGLVDDLLPHESAFLRPARATSPVTWIEGEVVPVVRRPVAVLPSGRHVLGLGDAVVLNDPLTGQGANNATRMARFFAERLTAFDGPYTASWLTDRFDEWWERGRFASDFTNGLLAPLRDFQQDVLLAASRREGIGEQLFEGFNDPSSLFPWFFEEGAAREFLARCDVGRLDVLRYKLDVGLRVVGQKLGGWRSGGQGVKRPAARTAGP